MTVRTIRVRSRRVAAVAPEGTAATSRVRIDPEAHAMAVEWGQWHRTRGLFGAPRNVRSVLGNLRREPAGTGPPALPNAGCSRELQAFNQAVIAYPDSTARAAFEQAFALNARPVKVAAAALGVNRTTWYRMVASVTHNAYASFPRWLGTGTF